MSEVTSPGAVQQTPSPLTAGEGVCLCGCNRSLAGRRKGTKYFNANCRSKSRKPLRPFIALDGEAMNDNYTLLASSNNRYIESLEGLDTATCLDYLLSLGRGASGGTRPIYVWFAFDYDVNMILKDVPLRGPNSIEELKTENKIRWNNYRITYIRRKILRISDGTRSHTSYDIWGFFQSTFENALLDWGLEPTPLIVEGKAARAEFGKWPMDKIRAYNQDELVLLAELAELLREAVSPLDLPIQSWHGPAALAGAWLRKNNVASWMNKPEDISVNLEDICTRAYFGGRIDVMGYGIIEPVYHYDIVSAYPAAIANLPDLSLLRWKRQGKKLPDSGRLYVARITWRIPDTYWAPFPWRSKNGSIRYPLEGEGWYWNYEIEMALQKYGAEHFEIQEVYVAEGEYQYPFHSLIHDTFKYRGELKRQGHPSHKAVKLVLNSLYGKFAQTVGKATYFSPIWAGMITSQTRAKLMEVIDDSVVCVMTDSIWSEKPLSVPIGNGLGDWEEQPEKKLILAEAGLYQAVSLDGESHVWQRGFDKRNPVDIQTLVQKWLWDDPSYRPSYEVLRFIGMGLATTTRQPWRKWVSISRVIEPVPFAGTTKRKPLYPVDNIARITPTFQRLELRERDTFDISFPYEKLTIDPAITEQRLQEECNDDA